MRMMNGVQCVVLSVNQPMGENEQNIGDDAQPSESMAELQHQDVDISPILRWRIAQNIQPRPKEMLVESEATEILWGQWHNLVVIDEVLYHKAKRYHAQTSVLQLVVTAVKRTAFIAQCRQVGTSLLDQHWIKSKRESFSLVCTEM